MTLKPLTGIAGLLAFVLTAAMPLSSPAETARGRVFHDQDRDGRLTPGEPGVAGVGVSNGVDVVETDAEGRYTLEIGEEGLIFVIKPSHWQVATDPRTHLPRHFYVHRPEGSPKSKYPGIAPTGPLPASIDFPLVAQDESAPFTVLCFGDTQPRDQKEVDYISHDVLEELIGVEAAFGMTLGDIVFNNLDMLDEISQGAGTLGIPWHHVIGNHDINFDTPDYQREAETYTRVIGPPYYSFNYGKVHFLVLNDIYWEVENKRYHGEFGPDQLKFIAADLARVPRDYLIVPLMHIPLPDVVDREALFELLKPFPHTFSIASHWHRQRHFYMDAADGWTGEESHHHLVQGTACGAWWSGAFDELGIPHTTMSDGTPNGYAFLTFDENRYSVRYKASRRPASYQMNIAAPEAITPDQGPASEVVVNVFAGSERSQVRMRVKDVSDWVPMTQFNGIDPYVAENKDRERALAALLARAAGNTEPDEDLLKKRYNEQAAIVGRSLPDARETDHMWKGTLPASMPTGYHVIEIETTDEFDQVFIGHRIIRVISGD